LQRLCKSAGLRRRWSVWIISSKAQSSIRACRTARWTTRTPIRRIYLIKQCLRELSETGKTVLPIYDFSAEKRSAEVEPIDLQGGVCIVEGIHALNPELTGLVPAEDVYRIYAGLRNRG
jgi:hypothetical protein